MNDHFYKYFLRDIWCWAIFSDSLEKSWAQTEPKLGVSARAVIAIVLDSCHVEIV